MNLLLQRCLHRLSVDSDESAHASVSFMDFRGAVNSRDLPLQPEFYLVVAGSGGPGIRESLLIV